MKTTTETFADSALAMIADLEQSHGVSFTPNESRQLQEKIAEVANQFWFSTKQGKKHLQSLYK